MFFNWWQALAYLGIVAGILARAKAQFPGRPVRTMIVLEDPATPMTVDEAQVALAATGKNPVVLPGFTVTP